jgi:hypothetical protein
MDAMQKDEVVERFAALEDRVVALETRRGPTN